MKKKATIKDVAAHAGASITTVSRVLSGSDYPVSATLREAILKAADELSYVPNKIGKLLRCGKSHLIGMVVPSITTPFYSQLIAAVQEACVNNDYVLMLYSSHSSKKGEGAAIDALIQNQVDGAVLSLIHWDKSVEKRLDEMGMVYVLFDQPHDEYNGISVDFDFCEAGRVAANYLVDCGNRDIVFASGKLDRPSRKQLMDGFKCVMDERGITFDDSRIIINEMKAEVGTSSVRDYHCGEEIGKKISELDYLPDAVFAVNDMMAIGIIKELEKNDVYVPTDISVMGFDDVEFAEMITPALTTISQSAYQMGEFAMKLLLENMAEKRIGKKSIQINPVLIERNSVKNKNKEENI